jgi:glutaredoxin
MSATVEEQPLTERHRRVYRALIEAVLTTGDIPAAPELAALLATSAEEIRESLRALAAADYLALNAGHQVTCLYPFSATPTTHAVLVEGERRFAMCAIDALGIPAMLGRELDLEGRYAVCDAAIALRVRPGAIDSAAPPTAMVVARRDEDEPAFAACCPFTVFVCGAKHAERFARSVAGAHALSLEEALTHAEGIFGDLLADAIPARRPRGRKWGRPEMPETQPEPVLFTQAGCAESAKVRAWLTDHGIAFTERDAGRDPEAAEALVATGTFATPLVVVGEERVLGFRPEQLAATLRAHRRAP